ncbi:MAG: hypothetical protein ACREKE_02800, partial [bacterium]
MPVDATISSTSSLAVEQTREMSHQENVKNLPIGFVGFTTDPNVDRPPDYYIHIYNISPMSFFLTKPPLAPIFNIPPCEPGTPYRLIASLPNVVNQKHIDSSTGQILNTGFRGEAVANDILNPSNTSGTPWSDKEDWMNVGTDLTTQGCFWSRENPPSAADLAKAKSRMERRFTQIVEEGNKLHTAGKLAEINPDHHQAAAYFHLQTPWHRTYEAPVSCPSCGEEIKAGVAFHRNSANTICILDWKRSVEAGIKDLMDVPFDQRW